MGRLFQIGIFVVAVCLLDLVQRHVVFASPGNSHGVSPAQTEVGRTLLELNHSQMANGLRRVLTGSELENTESAVFHTDGQNTLPSTDKSTESTDMPADGSNEFPTTAVFGAFGGVALLGAGVLFATRKKWKTYKSEQHDASVFIAVEEGQSAASHTSSGFPITFGIHPKDSGESTLDNNCDSGSENDFSHNVALN